MKLENLNSIEIRLDYEDIVIATCKETIEKIKANARKQGIGGEEYINNWTYGVKKDKEDFVGVVYNKDHYRLTHLLEKGHNVRNKYGGTKNPNKLSYVAPREHIKPAFNDEKDKYIEKMARANYEINAK